MAGWNEKSIEELLMEVHKLFLRRGTEKWKQKAHTEKKNGLYQGRASWREIVSGSPLKKILDSKFEHTAQTEIQKKIPRTLSGCHRYGNILREKKTQNRKGKVILIMAFDVD